MVGFGYKQAWLAVRGAGQAEVLDGLGAMPLGELPWRAGIDQAYITDDVVVATPPLPGAGAEPWVLVPGRWLLLREELYDIAALSAKLGREVQLFATYRVTELHHWERAVDGVGVRAFRYVGTSGEVTDWRGDPDATELAIGLPPVLDPEGDVLVDEADVLRVAAAWSIRPPDLEGRAATGPLVAARI
jgi:hypothetical protein